MTTDAEPEGYENDAAIIYEIDLSRKISTDFLQEARGAIYQEEIKNLAKDFAEDGYEIETLYRFGPGTVSIVLAARDPEQLQALSDAAQAIGYELPEHTERLAYSPETSYGLHSQVGNQDTKAGNVGAG